MRRIAKVLALAAIVVAAARPVKLAASEMLYLATDADRLGRLQ